MRYPASEKLEIIRTAEASHLPATRTLAMIGIPSSTYYQWYARWVEGGLDALADRSPRPGSVWNRIPDEIREEVVEFALEHEDLTPRERECQVFCVRVSRSMLRRKDSVYGVRLYCTVLCGVR